MSNYWLDPNDNIDVREILKDLKDTAPVAGAGPGARRSRGLPWANSPIRIAPLL